MQSVLLAVVLTLAPPPEEAKRHASDAKSAIDAGDFAAALESIERAYELDPNPIYLYARAQAKRLLGRCEDAIEDYRLFLEEDVPEVSADDARVNIRRCRDQVEEAEPAPEPVPDPTPPPPPVEAQPAPPARAEFRPWYRDPTGAALVGVGAVALVAGITMYAVAVSALRNPARSDGETDYAASVPRRQSVGYAGIGVAATGALIAVGGAIRWGIVRRRSGGTLAITWR